MAVRLSLWLCRVLRSCSFAVIWILLVVIQKLLFVLLAGVAAEELLGRVIAGDERLPVFEENGATEKAIYQSVSTRASEESKTVEALSVRASHTGQKKKLLER